VYARPDVALLDDPLSAVDAHVAHHIFEHAILGELKGATRVLVTHQVDLAIGRADYVVFIEKGSVVEHGARADLEARSSRRLSEALSSSIEKKKKTTTTTTTATEKDPAEEEEEEKAEEEDKKEEEEDPLSEQRPIVGLDVNAQNERILVEPTTEKKSPMEEADEEEDDDDAEESSSSPQQQRECIDLTGDSDDVLDLQPAP